jgi:putative ABC transport system permease protein
MLSSLLQDATFAWRQLRRAPGFVAVTVLTLALGIGATTAIFSVVHGVLVRALPYPASDRIVQLWQVDAAQARMQFSDPSFDDVRERAQSFSGVAEFANGPVSASGDVAPTRASLTLVTHDFFDVLGVPPAFGRTFSPEEEQQGGVPAVVVSWGFWQRALGARRDVLGARIVLGDGTYTVVGVMRPALDFPAGTDLWGSREIPGRLASRTAHNWEVIGRLRPGVTLDGASRDVRSLAPRLGTDVALVPLREQLVGSTRPMLLILLVASMVLLGIACANVANLLVARLAARRTEMALRLALGAGRTRLVQQCLTESLLLALGGGGLGAVLAALGTRALLALDPGRLPRVGEVRVDGPVLAFALGMSLATALALGLVSAARATRADMRADVRGIGSPLQARRALVVAQVALTVVLLVAAGLLARSFVRLLDTVPGFRRTQAVVLDVAIEARDSVALAQRTAFYRELITRLGGIPGVTAVGAINVIPLAPVGMSSGNFIELSSPDDRTTLGDVSRQSQDHARTGQAAFRVASGGYFAAMHIPVLEGRTFDDRDTPDAPHAALVSAALARERWPERSAIGRWIQFGNMDGDLRPFVVVGVVGDVREAGLDAPTTPTLYADYVQRPVATARLNVVLDGTGGVAPLAARARAIAGALRPDVPVRIRTIESIVAGSVARPRFILLLVGVFGAAALLLAALGVYSVISYLVTQRAKELGIRVALGARPPEIMRLVLGQGAGLAAAGIVAGTVVAVLVTRLLAGLLYGTSALDPLAFGAVVVLVSLVALAACWIPARRAGRLEVMQILRGG